MMNATLMNLASKFAIWPWLSDNTDDFGVLLRLGSIEIRWYAICILFGALLALFRCRYELKKRGMPEDYYDNFFLSVLPISIIGARVWYIISSPDEFHNLLEMIGIYNGKIQLAGLAIQGGVLFGLAWGVIYFKFIKPRYPVALHVDLIVPSILIGQVFGRWGNFFNGEVYGKVVSRDSLWYLPKWIINNCTTGSLGSQAGQSQVHIPLFFIEGALNTIGFILIGYVLWRFWKKFRKPYCVAACYFIWYGVVRVLLEPLRESQFIMQTTFFGMEVRTSIFMSIVFIILGIAVFVASQIIYRKVPYEKIYVNEKYEAILAKEEADKKEELQKKIDVKKAEIRARKAAESSKDDSQDTSKN